ncbi:hypothetical protein [Niallia taxi]|uniref:hypothetical protein n=1 Tax=Niallia taxi TaxID=2499688 RepID=UPI002E1A267B|nr:hypothetical protein [Niallia taxi]
MGVFVYVNDNGEFVKEFSDTEHTIRNKKQDEFILRKRKVETEFDLYNEEAGKFIWSYPDKIQYLIHSEEFTKSDLTMIFYLATYINGFGYITFDNNNVKMSKKDIQERLGISRNAFSNFFNKLVNHQILIPEEVGFKWDETYNFYGKTKGKAKPKMLVRTYVNQVRELYEAVKPDGKKKHSAVSLYPVFALVPYLHNSTNIVCKNPEVKNIEDIEYFNLKEITKLLVLNQTKKVSSGLSSLLLDGQTVFVKVTSKNETYFKLNPRIFWKGTTAPDKRLVAEFDMVDNNRKKRKCK